MRALVAVALTAVVVVAAALVATANRSEVTTTLQSLAHPATSAVVASLVLGLVAAGVPGLVTYRLAVEVPRGAARLGDGAAQADLVRVVRRRTGQQAPSAGGAGLRFQPMRPRAGEVLHFSEDPSLTLFVPHVARTASDATARVWAVDAAHAPGYWFPRQCPRAMAWVRDGTTDADRQRVLGPHTARVHVVEYGWLQRLQTAQVFAYRFDAAEFEPYGDARDPHAFVADHPVRPLGPAEPVGDLLALHEAAQIELRLTHSLWPWWDAVVTTTVGFSGIRLRDARRPTA